MRDSATILARFPGPVRLQLSFLRRLGGLALCLGLLVFSGFLLVYRANNWYDVMMTWLSLAVFGALSVRAVILLLAPDHARLTLDADGFECATVFSRVRRRWRDASGFRVVETDDARPPVVAYDAIVPGDTGRGAKETHYLPHDYSLDIEDLARLMNAWRERALAHPPATRASVPSIGGHP